MTTIPDLQAKFTACTEAIKEHGFPSKLDKRIQVLSPDKSGAPTDFLYVKEDKGAVTLGYLSQKTETLFPVVSRANEFAQPEFRDNEDGPEEFQRFINEVDKYLPPAR